MADFLSAIIPSNISTKLRLLIFGRWLPHLSPRSQIVLSLGRLSGSIYSDADIGILKVATDGQGVLHLARERDLRHVSVSGAQMRDVGGLSICPWRLVPYPHPKSARLSERAPTMWATRSRSGFGHHAAESVRPDLFYISKRCARSLVAAARASGAPWGMSQRESALRTDDAAPPVRAPSHQGAGPRHNVRRHAGLNNPHLSERERLPNTARVTPTSNRSATGAASQTPFSPSSRGSVKVSGIAKR